MSINLRSDTVTLPSPDMRKAMHEAELGDDYYRADPTVNRLEQRTAEIFGKEAALFVTSGTMGNLTSVLSLTSRGDSIVAEENSHLFLNEAGNLAVVGGITVRCVRGNDGTPILEEIEKAIFPRNRVLHPPTSVITIENTHNLAGGTCISLQATREIAKLARSHGLTMHIDGARIFNAAVALGVSAAELAEPADTITFCLSKGLGCPAGSLVVGAKTTIEKARHYRQMLGGALRQAGVLAAAGLYALDNMLERLSEDHLNAQLLGKRLQEALLPVDGASIETNMVYLRLPTQDFDPSRFLDLLAERGVTINPPRAGRVRFVTHCDVSRTDIETAAAHVVSAFRDAGRSSGVRREPVKASN